MKRLIRILYFIVLLGIIISGLFFISVRLLNYLAVQDYEQNRGLSAITKLNLALRINPNFSASHFNLGNCYMELDDYPKAIREFRQFISQNPEVVEPRINLANAYFYSGQYQDALSVLEEIDEQGEFKDTISNLSDQIRKTYSAGLVEKGLEYFEKGDFDSAIQGLNQAMSINPKFVLVYHNLGRIYFLRNDFIEADRILKKCVELDSSDIESFKLLAEIKYNQGEYNEAIEYFNKVLLLDPKYAKAYNDICFAYYKIGDYDNAIFNIKQAVWLEPENSNYRYSLASILRDAGYYDEALEHYLIVAKSKPDLIGLHKDIAGIYFLKAKTKEGNEELEKEISQRTNFLSNNPDDTASLLVLAEAYEGKAEYNKAKEVYKKIPSKEINSQSFLLDKINTLEVITEKQKKDLAENKQVPLNPDTINLKNGRKIKGRVVYEDNQKVILEISFQETKGTVTLDSQQVQSIERNNI